MVKKLNKMRKLKAEKKPESLAKKLFQRETEGFIEVEIILGHRDEDHRDTGRKETPCVLQTRRRRGLLCKKGPR